MQIPAALLSLLQPKPRENPIQKEAGTSLSVPNTLLGSSTIQISQWPSLAPFLTLLEQHPAGLELWQNLFQNVSSQSPDSQSLQKFTTQLYQQLSESTVPELQRLAPSLLKVMQELEIPLPPVDRIGEILRHFSNNDFPAVENSLRALIQTFQHTTASAHSTPNLASKSIPSSSPSVSHPRIPTFLSTQLPTPVTQFEPPPATHSLVRLWPALREFVQWSAPEQKQQIPSAPEALRFVEEKLAFPSKSIPSNQPSGLFVAKTQLVSPHRVVLEPQTPLHIPSQNQSEFAPKNSTLLVRSDKITQSQVIPLPPRIEFPIPDRVTVPAQPPLLQGLQENQILTWRSIPLPSGQAGVLPLPYTADIAAEEQIQWVKASVQATPNFVTHRNQIQVDSPEIPLVHSEILQKQTEILHQLDLQLPPQVELPENAHSLTLRWILSPPSNHKPSLDHLLSYLFHQNSTEKGSTAPTLPAEAQIWMPQIKGKTPIMQPKELAQILDQIPESSLKSMTPEAKTQLQDFKQHLQWTQFDEETRHPDDRQQLFYFHHQGELLRSRIRYRFQENNESNAKSSLESTHHVSIETSTPRLGNVHLELDQKGTALRIEFLDNLGAADVAVQQERQSLTEELEQIGYQLQELFYRRLPMQNILSPNLVANQQPSSTHLDLRV